MSTEVAKKTERKKPAPRKAFVLVAPSSTRTRTITPPKRLGYAEDALETPTVKRAIVKPKATTKKSATAKKVTAAKSKAKSTASKTKKSSTSKSNKKSKSSK